MLPGQYRRLVRQCIDRRQQWILHTRESILGHNSSVPWQPIIEHRQRQKQHVQSSECDRLRIGYCGSQIRSLRHTGPHLRISHRNFSIYNDSLPQAVKSGKLTYYDVLQISNNAKTQEIKQAYLSLVKKHHPDANIRPCSPAVFICIKEAHDVLSDPEQRRRYDTDLLNNKGGGPQTIRKPVVSRSSGYEYSQAHDDERWERYRRYVNGERADHDGDRYMTAKTICALCVSVASVVGLTIFADDVFNRFHDINTEDDDCRVDSRNETIVKAYYNPVSGRWERLIEPFVAPSPSDFLRHYVETEELDPKELKEVLPKREFVILELPYSRTQRPTLLWDTRSSRLVIFKD